MSPAPFRGRRAAVADAVGVLVTLGTPHGMAAVPPRARHAGLEAVRFLDRQTPGAWFAPTTAYLSVGSDFIRPGMEDPIRRWDRARGRAFRSIVGPTPAAGGDGIVPITTAHLSGAEQLTFHDVRHGHTGSPWYADDEIVDRWWPRAVELWQGAVEARADAADAADADTTLDVPIPGLPADGNGVPMGLP